MYCSFHTIALRYIFMSCVSPAGPSLDAETDGVGEAAYFTTYHGFVAVRPTFSLTFFRGRPAGFFVVIVDSRAGRVSVVVVVACWRCLCGAVLCFSGSQLSLAFKLMGNGGWIFFVF